MTHGASSPTIPRIGLAAPTNGPSTPNMESKASILGTFEKSSISLSRPVNPRLTAVSATATKRVSFFMVVLSFPPCVDATDVRPEIGSRQTAVAAPERFQITAGAEGGQ